MSPDTSDIHHGDYERTACLVFCAVTPLFVFARCWSRIHSKQFGADDWAAVAAFVCVLSCNVQTLVSLDYGWGRHVKNLTPRQITICLILHWTFQLTYKFSVALNKCSILLLYRRILVQRTYQIAIWSLLTLVMLFGFATSIAGIFQCVPIDKAWKKKKPGYCYNLVDAWYSNAVFSIVTDFLILLLPMHMVWKLQVHKREKLLLAAMFGLGGFVTFTSVMRFFALKTASSPDTTYEVNSGFWSVIEINVGVICISLPPLRVFLSRYLPFLNRTHGSYGQSSGRMRYRKNSHSQARERRANMDNDNDLDFDDEIEQQTDYDGQTKMNGVITKRTEIVITNREGDSRRESDEVELRPYRNTLR